MTGTPQEQESAGREQREQPPLPGPVEEAETPMTIISGPQAQDSPDWRPERSGGAGETSVVGRSPAPARRDQPLPATVPSGKITTFFSSTQRKGRWQVPELLTVSGGFSDSVLDLREAVVTTSTVELRLNEVFSSCTIIVPRGVGVDITGGGALFSSLDGDYEGVSDPGMWRLTVVHNGAFSSLQIISLAPGEPEPKWWKKLF